MSTTRTTRIKMRFLLPESFKEAHEGLLVYEQSLQAHHDELVGLLRRGGVQALIGDEDEWEIPHLVGRDARGEIVALISLMHNVFGAMAASLSIRSTCGRKIILLEKETELDEFAEDCYLIASLNREGLRWSSLEYNAKGELVGSCDWEELAETDPAEAVIVDRDV
jgi:hypothetical protein